MNIQQFIIFEYRTSHNKVATVFCWGRDSSVSIATALRAGRSGDGIPMGARFSAPVQTGPGAHPASHTMGTGSFTWGKPAGAWR